MVNLKKIKSVLLIMAISTIFVSCSSTPKESTNSTETDTVKTDTKDSLTVSDKSTSDTAISKNNTSATTVKADQSKVLIYNFHVTNRCVSCVAIEEATTKTLNKYFSNEVKSGRIKRQILNVDEDANNAISEKYQAFGSGLFVTKVYKGKETTTDLTGDGFKFAKNKEDKFIEILKTKISEYLK